MECNKGEIDIYLMKSDTALELCNIIFYSMVP